MTETVKPRCFEATDLESARQALARVLPVAENDLPWRALAYAHGQLGASDAFAHGVGTALIVAELRVGADAVAAALLQGCLDDAPARGMPPDARPAGGPGAAPDFDLAFGTAARLARGVAAMARIEALAASATDKRVDPHAQLEALRQMVLAMVEDIRVVLVKLAERTHALRCAATQRPDQNGAASQDAGTREALGQQARELFAPLANRLGVWQIKWEMEDWAFRYLEPDTYKSIAAQLDEKRADREAYINGIIERLQAELALHGIEAEVTGRPKHIASIVNKMRRKRLSFEKLYDIRAVRVLVKHEIDCYTVLGLVHNLWQPIPGEFDDYISQPKSNDYRSLHTAVIGPEDRAVEVQIRTFDMHRQAELGVAAHWRYKEGGKQDAQYEEKIAWLRRILEWKDDVADSSEFTEQFKTELFHDQVYVLTPQGRVVALDRGATPVDFAYALHTDLGHRCRGAKVNGAMVPLNTVLDNGQRVEIVTAKEGAPSRDWLNPALGYLATQRARSKVRAWFRQRDVGEQVSLGRSLLEKELKRLGVVDANQEKLAQRLKFGKVDEFLAALGRGDVGQRDLVNALQESGKAVPALVPTAKPRARPRSGSPVVIPGLGDVPLTLARCCKPQPPEPIVAYTTVGRGVTVHRADCASLKRANPARMMAAEWGLDRGGAFEVNIQLKAYDRQGLLRDISDVIAKDKLDVLRVNTESRGEYAHMQITVRIKELQQLARLLARLQHVQNVIDVMRG
ncbi:MAG: bifunctional (p)ppGpp synthetase/guanosine-3',5'-bis(diphosphate) 3'-pyrophosphohydrolase [Gammaproteobacteria bacterium]|nr:bifunctional (p)ppGpp synthetase/guanosine-3',5'-bis(diphosphate) 3'-pyrophosphohydrolase [Gammaproteobacteria bacterium]MBU1406964.1 bifunctional (p)ppGpp synthetase/guanosine-3',5'-bis(diphosphate) 3'-pyrophosphohydrolase [Gammaproteobacteria bacterium]MBU1533107.1 bifunctional (p)ppGpp synthetase/guanosine-3',5'-bis(diphosphate) 3'-pyrophosphohydrolase [Gammaproteobacteria bacterium]